MNNLSKKLLTVLFVGLTFNQASIAATDSIKWTGVVKEQDGYHTPKHEFGHTLEFVRQDDQKTFELVDSEGLLNIHSAKEKNLLVEVEGEITPRFLFWGGNLVVKSFKVLNELDDIPHHKLVNQFRHREFGFGKDRI